ncbi:unnamed protein product [Dibothriocephalus latus]|uniref:Uncharacterized protein n=1 Tax=Dibothriocephalus latus TaxID=60516 RepID=A0A3P6QHL7_DIBLA|nr:unnamed protein product [Dibothriocephalus latus]
MFPVEGILDSLRYFLAVALVRRAPHVSYLCAGDCHQCRELVGLVGPPDRPFRASSVDTVPNFNTSTIAIRVAMIYKQYENGVKWGHDLGLRLLSTHHVTVELEGPARNLITPTKTMAYSFVIKFNKNVGVIAG